MIPHHRGIELGKRAALPGLSVLLILEHLIHVAGSNRIKVSNDLFKRYGISRNAKLRWLGAFAKAGVLKVEQSSKAAPVVTHLWYTKGGKLKQ